LSAKGSFQEEERKLLHPFQQIMSIRVDGLMSCCPDDWKGFRVMKVWKLFTGLALVMMTFLLAGFPNTSAAPAIVTHSRNMAPVQKTNAAPLNMYYCYPQEQYQVTCNNVPPYETKNGNDGQYCTATSRVIDSVQATGGMVYLMYSDGCQTNWSEFYIKGTTPHITNANITRDDGVHYESTWNNVFWVASPMVWSPVRHAKACGSTNNWAGACTPYR
jgi:hypothetical protein